MVASVLFEETLHLCPYLPASTQQEALSMSLPDSNLHTNDFLSYSACCYFLFSSYIFIALCVTCLHSEACGGALVKSCTSNLLLSTQFLVKYFPRGHSKVTLDGCIVLLKVYFKLVFELFISLAYHF